MIGLKSLFTPRVKQAGAALGVAAVLAVGVIATMGQSTPGPPVVFPLRCPSPGERLEWDGSAWQCRVKNDYRSTCFTESEDFLASNANGSMGSVVTGTGAGGSTVVMAGRAGVNGFTTGTTSTGTSRRQTSSVFQLGFNVTSVDYTAVGNPETLSSSSEGYAVAIGTRNTYNTLAPAEGCYAIYDERNAHSAGFNPTNAHKWGACCTDASTHACALLDGTTQTVDGQSVTTVNTPVTALNLSDSTSVIKWRIHLDQTSAKFYADTGAGEVLRATITTRLPTSAGFGLGFGVMKSVGTTSIDGWAADFHQWTVCMSAARSP